MSQPPSQCMSASNEEEISLKQIAFDLRALLRWKEDEIIAREREKQERDRFHQLLDEERRGTRNMERLHERMSNRSQHLYSHTPTLVTHYEEDSRLVDNFYQPPPPLRRERREPREPRAIRIDLPHFYGKDDVEAYLDWEMKVEQLFACHQISEERKVPLATLSFQGNAMYWWTALERDRRINQSPEVKYWNDLKGALRRRHIPSYYHRELMDKLQRLHQNKMKVEEYRQKMELYMMRAGIRESEDTTIARFLSGLSLEIRDRVELLPYQDLNDLVQLCIKVEQQILRKNFRNDYSNSYTKKEFKREGKQVKEEPSKSFKEKEKPREGTSSHTRTSEIKCFKCLGRGHVASQCPTKKTMILRGVDHYSSQDEQESESETSSEESNDESKEIAYPCEGDLLMIRRLLSNQPIPKEPTQRENIFHTRCKILENTCSLIVDSGSCCNCCSTRLVDKLALTIIPHPKPYKLHWLNESGDLTVQHQVKVKLSIGKYEDSVLCDVVPMEACHVLLGRPWQFDKKTMHNGLTNEITFTHKDRKFVLHPLSPSQVVEDQIQMRKKLEKERKEDKKKVLPLSQKK